METLIPGYGDKECYSCKLAFSPYCILMVMATQAQIAAAQEKNWTESISWEHTQNEYFKEISKQVPCNIGRKMA